MSLSPKIDEINYSVRDENVDFANFTETWLSDRIHDNVIHIPGYSIARKDRTLGHHGGVCLYVKHSIAYQFLVNVSTHQLRFYGLKLALADFQEISLQLFLELCIIRPQLILPRW